MGNNTRNNSQPLEIFRPISAFRQPKFIDDPNFTYTFNGTAVHSMLWQFIQKHALTCRYSSTCTLKGKKRFHLP